MSGLTTATRLEQLEQLAQRVAHELAVERFRVATSGGRPCDRPARSTRRVPADLSALQALGVTAHDVRVWAVAHDLIPAGRVGRIAAAIYDAYAEAHPMQRAEA